MTVLLPLKSSVTGTILGVVVNTAPNYTYSAFIIVDKI